MQKTLIVANSTPLLNTLNENFRSAGWSTDTSSVSGIMENNTRSMQDYHCMVLVVDADFYKNDSVAKEVEETIRNCSKKTAIYLLHDSDNDACFAPMKKYTKQLFKLSGQQQSMDDAVNKIIKMGADTTHMHTFVSPMNYS